MVNKNKFQYKLVRNKTQLSHFKTVKIVKLDLHLIFIKIDKKNLTSLKCMKIYTYYHKHAESSTNAFVFTIGKSSTKSFTYSFIAFCFMIFRHHKCFFFRFKLHFLLKNSNIFNYLCHTVVLPPTHEKKLNWKEKRKILFYC